MKLSLFDLHYHFYATVIILFNNCFIRNIIITIISTCVVLHFRLYIIQLIKVIYGTFIQSDEMSLT